MAKEKLQEKKSLVKLPDINKTYLDQRLDGDATWLPEELKQEYSDYNLYYFAENRVSNAHAKQYDFVELTAEGIEKFQPILGSIVQPDGKIVINGSIFGKESKMYLMCLPKSKFNDRKDKERTKHLGKGALNNQILNKEDSSLSVDEIKKDFTTEVFGEKTFSPL